MANLHKTFKYTGDNLDLIKEQFPAHADAKLEFILPAYKFFNSTRQFSKDVILSKTVPLTNSEYEQKVGLEIIASNDYGSYLKYYVSNLLIDGQLVDLPSYIDSEHILVNIKINQFNHERFFAIPFVSITGDANLLGISETLDFQAFTEPDLKPTTEGVKKYLDENLFLLNSNVLNQIEENADDTSIGILLLFLSFSIKADANNNPILSIPSFENLELLLSGYKIYQRDYRIYSALVEQYFEALFDFPINVPEIQPVIIKGDIKFLGEGKVIYRDLSLYDLTVDYQIIGENGTASSPQSIKYQWGSYLDTPIPDRKVDIDFQINNEFVLDAKNTNQVTVSLKLFDGTVLWFHKFEPDDSRLSQIHIEIPLLKATELGTATNSDLRAAQPPLKGKVVEATGKCSLKDLTVILQVKAQPENPAWRVVGTATTDITGSFTMAYPLGIYGAAQAIVSIAPNKPIAITVYTDDAHKEAQQTIPHDFLYLLLEGIDCENDGDPKSDCDCHSPGSKTPRLPGQEDLIESDRFSQDLGGGACVNLTTPNRTLSEQRYYAVVRTTDPEVANYVLQKSTKNRAMVFKK